MKIKTIAKMLLGAAAGAAALNALKPGLLMNNAVLFLQRMREGNRDAVLVEEAPAERIPKVVGVS